MVWDVAVRVLLRRVCLGRVGNVRRHHIWMRGSRVWGHSGGMLLLLLVLIHDVLVVLVCVDDWYPWLKRKKGLILLQQRMHAVF